VIPKGTRDAIYVGTSMDTSTASDFRGALCKNRGARTVPAHRTPKATPDWTDLLEEETLADMATAASLISHREAAVRDIERPAEKFSGQLAAEAPGARVQLIDEMLASGAR
jgi:hypothetical protein